MGTGKNLSLKILDDYVVERVIETAYKLLKRPGLKVYNADARKLFAEAGAEVDYDAH